MLAPSISSRCVELGIRVCHQAFLVTLRVDGLSKDQREFDSEAELIDWVEAILYFTGVDLYVHLRARARHGDMALELARKLSARGMMIGITGQSSICRSGSGRLQ